MKKKSNYRTPKRLLSLFLCVLMLTTSVVIANPFTAEAANISDRVTFDESRYGNYRASTYRRAMAYNTSDTFPNIGNGMTRITFNVKYTVSGVSGASSEAVADSSAPNLTGLGYNTLNNKNYLNFENSDVTYSSDYSVKGSSGSRYYGATI